METEIKNLYKKSDRFLKALQRSNDKRKKRWLIGGTSLAMIFVFGFWLVYLNHALPSLAKKEIVPEKSDSFFGTFGKGLKIVAGNLKTDFDSIVLQFKDVFQKAKIEVKKSNEISVSAENTAQLNFVFNGFEEIPPTKLPTYGKRTN